MNINHQKKYRVRVFEKPSAVGVKSIECLNDGVWEAISFSEIPAPVTTFFDFKEDKEGTLLVAPNSISSIENMKQICDQDFLSPSTFACEGEDAFHYTIHWKEFIPDLIPDNVPAIRTLENLCDYFSADTPLEMQKNIYDATECGATISLYLPNGTQIHKGDSQWDSLSVGTEIQSFTIQTIVEGTNATVDSDHFYLPCTIQSVEEWIAEMESEAMRLWNEATTTCYEIRGDGKVYMGNCVMGLMGKQIDDWQGAGEDEPLFLTAVDDFVKGLDQCSKSDFFDNKPLSINFKGSDYILTPVDS